MRFRFDNMDASENAFFARQLEHIRPGVFEVRYAELIATSLVPINTSVHPGAEVFTYRAYDQVGKAQLASDLSKTGARADVFAKPEVTSPIRSMKGSYGYSIQEARAAMMAGLDLDPRKARAARRAIAQLMDDVLLLGDGTAPYLGLYGLFALVGTHTYTVPNGDAGDTEWSTKTADEVVADLHGIANGIVTNSKDVHQPDTLLLPLTSYQEISQRRMGDGSTMTILQFFLANSPYIKSVIPVVKLETAGSGGVKRMVAYKKDPDMVEGIVPVAFEQLAPQFDGYEVLTHCHGRIGGVVTYYPKSISYGDGI